MLLVGFLQWWYSQGWGQLASRVRHRLAAVLAAFSVIQILSTLFAPWKQIITERDPNASLGDRGRRLVDNLVSRVVGFFVRIFTLIAAVLVALFTGVFGLVAIILWPLLPLLSLAAIAKGLGLW